MDWTKRQYYETRIDLSPVQIALQIDQQPQSEYQFYIPGSWTEEYQLNEERQKLAALLRARVQQLQKQEADLAAAQIQSYRSYHAAHNRAEVLWLSSELAAILEKQQRLTAQTEKEIIEIGRDQQINQQIIDRLNLVMKLAAAVMTITSLLWFVIRFVLVHL